jgi:hypothetical protein
MIRIKGHLGATMRSAFPPLASHLHGAETVLTGCLDRSARYGVLAEIPSSTKGTFRLGCRSLKDRSLLPTLDR